MRPLILTFGAAAVTAVSSFSAIRRRRRRRGIAAFARRFGFEFGGADPFGLLYDYNFPLFEMGDGRGCENVVWGEWKGVPFRATDYWYYDATPNRRGSGVKNRMFNAVVVDVPLYLPRVTVEREGFASWAAERVGWRDIQFESEEFNRRFRIRAEDAEFAFKLIDAQMMHWMLSTDEIFGFQFYGRGILVWSKRLRPNELFPLIGTAKELYDHIPRLVWREYATGTPSAGRRG
jgi:hypothetical protein